jgi:hypothetical protein
MVFVEAEETASDVEITSGKTRCALAKEELVPKSSATILGSVFEDTAEGKTVAINEPPIREFQHLILRTLYWAEPEKQPANMALTAPMVNDVFAPAVAFSLKA